MEFVFYVNDRRLTTSNNRLAHATVAMLAGLGESVRIVFRRDGRERGVLQAGETILGVHNLEFTVSERV